MQYESWLWRMRTYIINFIQTDVKRPEEDTIVPVGAFE